MNGIDDHFQRFGQTRLLVADDDPIMREFAASHLATPSLSVDVAEDGAEGWTMLKAESYDLALVDLEMPRMDGFELIGLMRRDERLKHLPVVVVTGREDMMAVDRAFELGATSFVIKPINWRVLSHQLAYVLKNAQDSEQIRQLAASNQSCRDVQIDLLDRIEEGLLSPVQKFAKMVADPDCTDNLKAQNLSLLHDLEALYDTIQLARKR